MCIRDRHYAVRFDPERLDKEALLAPDILPTFSVETFTAKAVSYTHLRAHETVLDLVCRLLLEKKKYLQPQSHLSKTTLTNTT